MDLLIFVIASRFFALYYCEILLLYNDKFNTSKKVAWRD
uniref:Uncharacterized protein n=1 Tax=Physcomitrium patens TaxID=3218 RepID=A0A2K1IYR8_PHYPA|nr:hypothetical protein PHYPA_024236 [Physcomitrium patens]